MWSFNNETDICLSTAFMAGVNVVRISACWAVVKATVVANNKTSVSVLQPFCTEDGNGQKSAFNNFGLYLYSPANRAQF